MKQLMKTLMPLNIQMFAAGDNNDQPVRVYQKQFKELLTAVFNKQSYFGDVSPSGIEVLDAIQDNATAFSLKTSDIPVTVGTYNTDAAIAMGAGTSNTNRFGNRVEIIYTNTDVPYIGTWAYHEGIDRFTVNNNLDAAVADRLALQAQAKTQLLDNVIGKYISDNAGKTEALTALTDAAITTMFDNLAAYYTNIESVGEKVMKVNTALYNAIVKHPLATTAKSSSVNIDTNGVIQFRGFTIQEVPDAKFVAGEVAYVYIRGVGKPFLGINTSRAIESEDFDGRALQGAGKYGMFITNDNKKAVAKVTLPIVP